MQLLNSLDAEWLTGGFLQGVQHSNCNLSFYDNALIILRLFTGLTLVSPGFSCTGEPRAEHIAPAVTSPVLREGKDHLSQSAGDTLLNAARDAVDLLCPKGMLLATRTPGPFLSIWLPASCPPVHTGTWGCPS